MSKHIKSIAQHVNANILKLSIKVNHDPSTHCFHLDYEDEIYREEELAGLMRDSIEYFALTPDEFSELKESGNLVKYRKIAWSRISTAIKNKKGDYGELLLYIILSLLMPQCSNRFVTKVRLRSSCGDQIKGYDCAHFTIEDGKPCLWLGEAKFHKTISSGINSASSSLADHMKGEYLKNEIKILGANIEINKLTDPDTYKMLDAALNSGQSVNRIKIRIPILLTYDSAGVKKNKRINEDFISSIKDEFEKNIHTATGKINNPPENIEFYFIFFPFNSVDNIKSRLEKIEEAMR